MENQNNEKMTIGEFNSKGITSTIDGNKMYLKKACKDPKCQEKRLVIENKFNQRKWK